jgi:hypothetical protein
MIPDSMRITITTGQNKVNDPYRLPVAKYRLPAGVTGPKVSKTTAIRSLVLFGYLQSPSDVS